MSSKTRIVVLHMKEIIYTAIFAVLAIVLILLLIFMFLPKVRGSHNKTARSDGWRYHAFARSNRLRNRDHIHSFLQSE